ncbi:MAG: Hsp20/alpha crystallin family protein, partial [Halobacteriaceae archaeon]
GATEDTVEAAVRGGRLRVEARREKAVPDGFEYRREGRPLFLDADLPLPPDAGGVGAVTVERGVLEVTVEKE